MEEPPAQQSSAFPAPPYYFQRYSQANLALLEKYKAHQASASQSKQQAIAESNIDNASDDQDQPKDDVDSNSVEREKKTPDELELDDPELTAGLAALPFPILALEPPPPVKSGVYWQFGRPWPIRETIGSLEEQGCEQLYPKGPIDRVKELKKLNHSAVFNFLELVHTLATSPSEFPVKVDQIRMIFINMHHIINEYRPHQARETLKLMMQDQLSRKRQETAALRQTCEDLRKQLATLREMVADSTNTTRSNVASTTTTTTAMTSGQNMNLPASAIGAGSTVACDIEMAT
ncbi:Mediator of RNA polymerase II transcription subunit 7 [Lunasporangiospora selenospora]|uniref:Mediator of RNA polymerase II transcription subunit 7 n=1 Tax=Lunasporangiospora selenospora TaxID=979761 RepID=A0A9P6G2E5_9FUNG|nr:Mediator of RNA polymerase II transcription subunit 7 [Lunasporangiospora selenospora]